MKSNDILATSSQFSDPNLRLVKESDAEAIAELYRLNYGEDYAFPEVYDGKWVKHCIYNDGIMCLVLEESRGVIGAGALMFEYGRHNDQIGELARLVVNPQFSGRGEGRRIIRGLFQAAQNNVEFAVGEARTSHEYSQKMVEREGFIALGFIPDYHIVCKRGESQVIYGKLYGNGAMLRSGSVPRVIPEIEPIAAKVLAEFGVLEELEVVGECPPYEVENRFRTRILDRQSLERLSKIKEGRVVEPLLFGAISLGEGYSVIQRKKAVYIVALDDYRPVGTIGYLHDPTSNILKGIELVGKDESLRGYLCECLVRQSERLGARVVEVNLSAYNPRLQRTFYEHGFCPVAYAPAMVFHGTERLDVVKMIKLNTPYQPGDIALTAKARETYTLIQREFSAPSKIHPVTRYWLDEQHVTTAAAVFPVVDSRICMIQEDDSEAFAELFRSNYGPDYQTPEVYDGTWVKKCVYNTELVGLVNREHGKITAAVSIQFDFGNQFDQIGKVARFVVDPKNKVPGLEQRMLRAIFAVAEDSAEFVVGDTLTDRPHVQEEVERAGLIPIGYLHHYWDIGAHRGSLVRYGKPQTSGLALRSNRMPVLIPEVAELAKHVLNAMGLATKVVVVEKCLPYPSGKYHFSPLDRLSLARLSWIREGRLIDPLMFGNVSIEQGYSLIRRRNAVYLMATDKGQVPVGAIGYQYDSTMNIVYGIEMIGKEPELRGCLLEQLLQAADELGARIVEADVSAYDPRVQRTFVEKGFWPVLYAPAMVFRGTERLDVVKMLKLNAPYEAEELQLTDQARAVVSIVERGYH
jgi:GNAT superfamily N-acetyltransferase